MSLNMIQDVYKRQALQEAIGVSANSVNGANTAGTEGVAATAAAQSQACLLYTSRCV